MAVPLALLLVALAGCGGDSAVVTEDWRVQIGSAEPDTSFGVAATPNGDVVVTASTEGDLAAANAGKRDIFLARYAPDGEQRWQVQFGGEANDSPLGISVAPDGTTYVGGFTEGDLAAPNQGSADVWLARFDEDGTEMWRQQFGADAWDRGFDVTAFDGGAYVTGYSASVLDPGSDLEGFDGYVARYTSDGTLDWIRHVGTDATDWGQGSALADDGGVVITGYTEGDLAAPNAGDKDMFAVKLSASGEQVWATQLGSAALDWTQGVGNGPDGGFVIVGSTEGAFAADPAGERDMIVVSLDADGNELWRRQLGTPGLDSAFEVRTVGDRIVVTGGATGSLAAGGHLGERDAVLVSLDHDGELISIDQFGTDGVDDATGLAVADDGSFFWSGYTFGSLAGDGAGKSDIVLGGRTAG